MLGPTLNGAGVPTLVFAEGRKGPVFLSIASVIVELLAVGCIDAKSVSGGVCSTCVGFGRYAAEALTFSFFVFSFFV